MIEQCGPYVSEILDQGIVVQIYPNAPLCRHDWKRIGPGNQCRICKGYLLLPGQSLVNDGGEFPFIVNDNKARDRVIFGGEDRRTAMQEPDLN